MPIALLRQARAYGAAQAHATTWLRLSTRGLVNTAGPLALYGARVKTDGTIAVYANGHLVHQAQRQGPLWNSTRTPLWVVLDAPAGGAPLDEILIRLEHTSKSQVAVSSLWLGPPDALSLRYQSRRWLQQELPAMLSAAFLAVGIFAFFVWVRRRHEIGYLLFFALSVTAFLRGLHFYVGLPIANDWFAWLTVNALFWLVTTLHFFLRLLHGRELPWLTRGLIAVTVLVAVTTLPALAVPPNTPSVTPLIYAVAALMGSTVFLVGGLAAWRDSREGRLVAVGLGVVLLLGFTDWLLQTMSSVRKAGIWVLIPTPSVLPFSARLCTGAISTPSTRWNCSTPVWRSACGRARPNWNKAISACAKWNTGKPSATSASA
jgi:hypothetical protein